jgi:hypothetical protein
LREQFLVVAIAANLACTASAATRQDAVDAYDAAVDAEIDTDYSFGQTPYIDAGDLQAEAWGAWEVYPDKMTQLGQLILMQLIEGDADFDDGDDELFPGIVSHYDALDALVEGDDWLALGDGEIDLQIQSEYYGYAVTAYSTAQASFESATAHYDASKEPYENAIEHYQLALIGMQQ